MSRTAGAPRYAGPPGSRAFAVNVRSRVHAYFSETGTPLKADGRLAIKVAAMLTVFLAPLIVVLVVPFTAWAALLMALVMGIGMAGIGMGVMHDGLHGASSSKPWVNELLGGTMYLLGSDAFTWKLQHNGAHHTHTNVDEIDQDIDPPDLLRFSEHAPRWRIHRFQHIYSFFFYGLLTLVKLGNDFFSLARASRDPGNRSHNFPLHFAGMVSVKLIHLFLFVGLPWLLTPFALWQVLIGFLAMHFTCGLILGTVFQLAHVVEGAQQPLPDPQGVINNDWAVHELLTTADFAPRSKLLAWYTGGLNFQIEHHLFPYISHLHYPAIAPIVAQVAAEHGLAYNVKPTLASAIRSHVRRLRQLGGSAS
ncbi:MAG: acyl-CoA desaturase [Flavobacteriales bacterium]|nr:acyl-CoA desaturase [Flavobacteriales bacterium]